MINLPEAYTILINAQVKDQGKIQCLSAVRSFRAWGDTGYRDMVDDVSLWCIERIAKLYGGALVEVEIYRAGGNRVDSWISGIEV